MILTPVSPTTAFKLTDKKTPVELYLEDIFTIPANLAGIPGLVVPAGLDNGLPVNVIIKETKEESFERCINSMIETVKEMIEYHKKNYKVGFLYDMLTVVYPSYSKSKKHLIISNKYHLWCTYRQLFTIINDYTIDRNKYLKNRKTLCI